MKTDLTKRIEYTLYNSTVKMGTFGCFEVTVGWVGKERVDYMTMDTKEVFRCYEIKISKSDFYSGAAHSFLGHYNYFVMPFEVYKEVQDDIPDNVGVYIHKEYKGSVNSYIECVKKPKKVQVSAETINVLKNSMIRSLSREAEQFYKSKDENILSQHKRQITQLNNEIKRQKTNYKDLSEEVDEVCGKGWNKPNSPCQTCNRVNEWREIRYLAHDIEMFLKCDSNCYEKIKSSMLETYKSESKSGALWPMLAKLIENNKDEEINIIIDFVQSISYIEKTYREGEEQFATDKVQLIKKIQNVVSKGE